MGEDEKPNWPPKTDNDWDKIEDAIWKVDMMWIFMRPLHSVRQDWKIVSAVILAWGILNREGLISLVSKILGSAP